MATPRATSSNPRSIRMQIRIPRHFIFETRFNLCRCSSDQPERAANSTSRLPVFHYKFQEESSAKMEQDENERSPLFYSPLIRRSVLITFLKTFLLPYESLTLKVGAHPLLLLHLADYGFPYFQDFYKRIPFKSSHCSRRWVSTAWFLALRLRK